MPVTVNEVISAVGLAVQFALAIVGIWYTLETQKLRRAGETQISLLREQSKSSLRPFIFPSVAAISLEDIVSKLETDLEISAVERENRLRELKLLKPKFGCNLSNESSRIATDLQAWIYDLETKSFLRGRAEIGVLGEKQNASLTFSPPYRSLEQVKSLIIGHFGHEASTVADSLSVANDSFCLVIFRDVEARSYSVIRKFIMADGEVHHITRSSIDEV